jgi:DNA-directed RNA polymerase specialized sigma24 family protein
MSASSPSKPSPQEDPAPGDAPGDAKSGARNDAGNGFTDGETTPSAAESEEAASEEAASGETASGEAASGETAEKEAERTRRRLLAPIGGLYGLAQALTSSERAARRLVEATYERAAEELVVRSGPLSERDARPHLFKLLVETSRQSSSLGEGMDDSETDEEAKAADGGGRDRHYRRRAQEAMLRRALPPAFAALAPAQRLLLTLRDVEALEIEAVAGVTGLPEDDAHRQHARARADLRDTLRQMAPRPERPFLDEDAFPDALLVNALRRMAERTLTAPPPALRPAARHALDQGRRTGRRKQTSASGAAPEAGSEMIPQATADRPAASSEQEASGSSKRLSRLAGALLLILAAGGLAYLGTGFLEAPGETNLTALTAQRASDVNVRLRTDRAARAEQFVRDELGRRLRVPQIDGASLHGVGVAEVVPGERVPVFLFRDSASERPVTAYAYDYALLDRAGDQLRLSPDLRRTLEEEGRVATEDVEGRRVLLWRHRDDIFAAVTERADSLQQRIAL